MPLLFPFKTTPRWIIFTWDVFVCAASLLIAYLLRFNFSIPEVEIQVFHVVIPFVLGTRALSFLLSRNYAGIIRYTGAKDAERIFLVITSGSLFFLVANQFSFYFLNGKYIVPTSVVFIDFFISLVFLASYRMVIKTIYMELKKETGSKTNVMIFGAGEAGIITARTLTRDVGTDYEIIGFIDDNKKKAKTTLEGVKVYHASELDELLSKNQVTSFIIAVQNLNPKRKSELIEKCFAHNVKVLNVPPVNDWINGQLSFRQIKDVRLEDLLGREPIQLDHLKISEHLNNKTILITGAAGSIGSELVYQISRFQPKLLILFDQAESPLYELELELRSKYNFENFIPVIGSVQNENRVKWLFQQHDIDLVYHAAAYKHVPMMESQPSEAIRDNVFGSKILANSALAANVDEFVMVSTDKAVNPTNVMGASKRIAEIYVQSLQDKGNTKFVTTRFGNVLGSNGSVIPLFKKQMEKGGPLTVTDPEVTRYFMTISEAAQLVLEASVMGKGGEIFVFDMGQPVKIDDLAKKMIKMSNLVLDKDIKIVYTGLRPGEKLYEELLTTSENTQPTHHPRIMIGKVREYAYDKILALLGDLNAVLDSNDNFKIVEKMKEIVPEFVSNNSEYEVLDKAKTKAGD